MFRVDLLSEFLSVYFETNRTLPPGFDSGLQEKFVRKCRRITEEIDESMLDVEHQFLTVEDMEGMGFSQPLINIPCFFPCTLQKWNSSNTSIELECMKLLIPPRPKIDGVKEYCKQDPSLTRTLSTRINGYIDQGIPYRVILDSQ